MQEYKVQKHIQKLQDELKSFKAMSDLHLSDKESELQTLEKKQKMQQKVVKGHFIQNQECMNQLMQDYKDSCNMKN